MDTKNFYRDVEVLPSFIEAANGKHHIPLPDDWWVIVADVVGSTRAIESGKYKDVNTVGAAMIMAVINVDRSIEIPFVFGGDGATLAIPECMVKGAREALLGAKQMAKDGFNIDLRVGMMPAKLMFEKNLWLGVGKYRHSENITQTSLSGFGWGWAESTLKDPVAGKEFEIIESSDVKPNADFTGFECRWRPVTARNDHKLAIIVQCTLRNSEEHFDVYDRVLRAVEGIYGDVLNYHPLHQKKLNLTFNPIKLMNEAKVRMAFKRKRDITIHTLKTLGICVAGTLMFTFKYKSGPVNWGNYKTEVVDNADFRKFDGALKMVIDGTKKQEAALREVLKKMHSQGQIIFGTHSSSHAIMTCLVFTAGQDHAHFVDGSDGGYAMAAKELKAQLAELKAKNAKKSS